MNEDTHVPGERTVAGVTRTQSRSIRLQGRLAVALVAAVGAGVLAWYYHHLSEQSRAAAPTASSATKVAAASEMKLPVIDWPRPRATPSAAVPAVPAVAASPATDDPIPVSQPMSETRGVAMPAPRTAAPANEAIARLSSPVLLRGEGVVAGTSRSTPSRLGVPEDVLGAVLAGSSAGAEHPAIASPRPGNLGDALVPTVTRPVEAAIVPSQRWLLPKGAFLDCTLETAIDSTLPGIATCVLASDAFSADGRIVLLERGTKLVGETINEVRAGQNRIGVLWSEARTPTGVVVELASPGTDALGRAGVAGAVDNHIRARFGAAVLLSFIDGAIGAVVAHQQGSAGVVYNAQGSRDIGTEVLRNTISIPATIQVAPGARIQVLVARNVDFRTVYRLVHRDDG